MHSHRLRELPSNFSEFIDEIAPGFCTLYGRAGEAQYRDTIVHRFQGNLQHPSVEVWGMFEGKRAAAILVALQRQDVGHIVLTHVLEQYQGHGVERTLIERSVEALRDR